MAEKAWLRCRGRARLLFSLLIFFLSEERRAASEVQIVV